MNDKASRNPPELEPPLRLKTRLSWLMTLLMAVGVVLGTAIPSLRQGTPLLCYPVWTANLRVGLGSILASLALMMVLLLSRQLIERLRTRTTWKNSAWPLLWRLAANMLLLAMFAEESRLLRMTPPTDWFTRPNSYVDLHNEVRLWVNPVVCSLIMTGLVLGLRSTRKQPPISRFALPAGLSGIVVSLGGVLIAAPYMMTPYLLLIQNEWFRLAWNGPGERSGGLTTHPPGGAMPPRFGDRLDAMIPETGLSLAVCLLSALWLESTLRRTTGRGQATRSERWSWLDLAIGLVLASAMLALTSRLTSCTFPGVEPWAMEGIARGVGGWEIGFIALGFSTFGAGLLSHALAPRVDDPGGATSLSGCRDRRVIAWLVKAGVAAGLGLVILSALGEIATHPWLGQCLPAWFVTGLLEPLRDQGWTGWAHWGAETWPMNLADMTSLWFPSLAAPWLVWHLWTSLTSAASPGSPTPSLDQAFDTFESGRRFVGAWAALTALMIAALPTLALAGLIVLHGLAP